MLKRTIGAMLVSSAVLLAESGVGINVNEQDLELEAVLDSRNLAALQTSNTIYQVDLNFLYNNENAKLFGGGIGATNKIEGVEGLEATLGLKYVWAEVGVNNNNTFNALPFMGKVRYTLPPLMYNIPPVAFEAKIVYAPKVLSFGDSEKYSEYRLNAEMEVINSGSIYVGYRNIHTKYNNIDVLFNNSFYSGLKITY